LPTNSTHWFLQICVNQEKWKILVIFSSAQLCYDDKRFVSNNMDFLEDILLGGLEHSLAIANQKNTTQKLAQANTEIQRISAVKQAQQTKRISELENQCAQLHLAITALTRYLTDHGLIQESELRAFIEQIDASDGALDGKLTFPEVRTKIKLIFPPKPQ